MVHKVLEELFDTLLFFVGAFGILIFFLVYWNNSFKIRYAEVVLQEFLEKIAFTGKITKENYEELQRNIYSIDAKYELKIQCIGYQEQPVYSLVAKDVLKERFQEKNIIKQVSLEEYEVPLLEETEELQLQKETNASVLAAVNRDYISLPVENASTEIIAARPRQEVYEGEKLVTVCKVISSDYVYYIEAGEIVAKESGEIELDVTVDGVTYKVPIQVICHPRIMQCDNYHTFINDNDRIEEKKQGGSISCPYCRMLPERISCNASEISLRTGEDLTEKNIGIEVIYMDGSVGHVTSESKEWQDNYDIEFCGKQTVTIRYRNAETQLIVISENGSCHQCGKNCNDRCREDYRDYPYCLDCLAQMYVFTGQVRLEEQMLAEKELLYLLDTEQELLLSRGDFVTVELGKGRYKTILQRKVTIDGVKRSQ